MPSRILYYPNIAKASAEANEKRSFSYLAMPSRNPYHIRIFYKSSTIYVPYISILQLFFISEYRGCPAKTKTAVSGATGKSPSRFCNLFPESKKQVRHILKYKAHISKYVPNLFPESKKQVRHILKYKAHISKYVPCIFSFLRDRI